MITNPKRKSPRAQWWEYSLPGQYFVTICTKDRLPLFGMINNGKMLHSPQGAVAYVLWNEISNHFEDVFLGPFVIMPDHVHGIISIKEHDRQVTEAAKPDTMNGYPKQTDIILAEYLDNLKR
ncbi:MAG: transposase [Balneolia bacterium]|nr:transposase [Balneolia bacterium]